MIEYTEGNLLEAKVAALVNAVNEVGAMGKGIARQFREAFQASAREYEMAARRKDVRVGHVLVTRDDSLDGPRWIIHFPTKRHWRQPSRLEWVQEGLRDLVRVVRENDIESIALPPLGCGNGGLDWDDVRREIEVAFRGVEGVRVVVYEPTVAYQTTPKPLGVEKLTPARALIAELVRRYSVLGLGCTNLEVHKLAWFLQRSIVAAGMKNPLRLTFVPDRYGPYADQLRHLLDALDGSYLHCDKRLSDAGPLEPIHFDDAKRDVVAEYLAGGEAGAYAPALEATSRLIDGFESPLGMELLATVDWLLFDGGCEPTVEALRRGLETWPGGPDAGERKLRLFDERLLGLAGVSGLAESCTVLLKPGARPNRAVSWANARLAA